MGNLEYVNSQNFQSLKSIELINNYLENKEILLSLHSYSKKIIIMKLFLSIIISIQI